MGLKLDKPILMIGGGAIAALWVLNSLIDILGHALSSGNLLLAIAAVAVGARWWSQRQVEPGVSLTLPQPNLTPARVQSALGEISTVLTQLETEANTGPPVEVAPQVERLQSQIVQVSQDLSRNQVRIVVMGSKGCGKTALISALQSVLQVESGLDAATLREAPSFSGDSEAGLQAEAWAIGQALSADLVLLLIPGDLTASELQVLQRLAPTKRLLLVLTKQDQQLPDSQASVMQRVQQQVQGLLASQDVLGAAAAPAPVKVRQYQADGSVKEWLEPQSPRVAELGDRLQQILTQEQQQLVLASSLQTALVLQTQAKNTLKEVRRLRALPLVERYQWISATAAFANPVPSLDILATAVINAQMVMDLGAVYRQKFSLAQAQTVAQAIATLMLKLGIVEVATQVVAGFLKVGLVTYVAGGALQGVSAAYLTRAVGLGLIDYFEAQDPHIQMSEAGPLAMERLGTLIQSIVQSQGQAAVLKNWVIQTAERLMAAPVAAPANPAIAALNLPLNLPTQAEGDRLEHTLQRVEISPRISDPQIAPATLPLAPTLGHED
jgi:uncharacterized protein